MRFSLSLSRLVTAGSVLALAIMAAGPAGANRAADRFPIARTLPLPGSEVSEARSPQRHLVAGAGPVCPKSSRATKDRPDVRGGRLVHVIYLVPSDGPDEALDTDGTLQCSMQAQQRWMKEQSEMSWRLDTYFATKKVGRKKVRTELVDITFVKSGQPSAKLGGAAGVSGELRLRGFEGDKRYLTFAASGIDGGPCGDAYWPYDSQDPNEDGQYAQVYMFSSDGCHAHEFGLPGAPSYPEMIAQQEIMHNDGMTPLGAPHGCGPLGLPAHVCTGPLVFTAGFGLDPEEQDILFPYITEPLPAKTVDIGHDDYFEHPFPYRDLADSPFLEPAK